MKSKKDRDEEIRKLYAEGYNREFLERKYGISRGRMSHILSPNWRAYYIIGNSSQWKALGFTKQPTVGDIIRRLGGEPLKNRLPAEVQKIRKEIDTEAKAMAERKFIPTKRQIDGRWQTGLKVECSKQLAGCLDKAEIFSSKDGTSPVLAAKKFSADNWHLGGGPHADICPHCWEKMKEMRKAVPEEAKPYVPENHNKEVHVNIQPAKPSSILMSAAPALTGPNLETAGIVPTIEGADRTVKKLINDKLHEVYPQLDEGYSPGWTDRRVATDLGAKVEWVAYIREEMFGPEKKPVRDFSKDIAALEEKGREILEINKNVTAMIDKMDELDKRFNDLIASHDTKRAEFLKAWGDLKKEMQEAK